MINCIYPNCKEKAMQGSYYCKKHYDLVIEGKTIENEE